MHQNFRLFSVLTWLSMLRIALLVSKARSFLRSAGASHMELPRLDLLRGLLIISEVGKCICGMLFELKMDIERGPDSCCLLTLSLGCSPAYSRDEWMMDYDYEIVQVVLHVLRTSHIQSVPKLRSSQVLRPASDKCAWSEVKTEHRRDSSAHGDRSQLDINRRLLLRRSQHFATE